MLGFQTPNFHISNTLHNNVEKLTESEFKPRRNDMYISADDSDENLKSLEDTISDYKLKEQQALKRIQDLETKVRMKLPCLPPLPLKKTS